MKFSFYNIIREVEGGHILYNTVSENMLILNSETKDLLLLMKDTLNKLQKIHPTLYNQLIEDQFIIDDNIDEQTKYINQIKQDDLPETFTNYTIIINPTLDCNLKCWYCYEQHKTNSTINKQTYNSIKKLIDNTLKYKQLKFLILSFFGGEPLLKFDDIILPLLKYCKDKCTKSKIDLTCQFTTNALLLTEDVSNNLLQLNIPISIQVPFDGDETHHNSVKKSCDNINTYQKTLKNVLYALKKGINFTIRCNCTEKTIDSFRNLVEAFLDCDNKRISFSIQRIWQEHSTPEFLEKEKQLYNFILNHNFNSQTSNTQIDKCYADTENSVVINYNGDIYKCTARDFNENNKMGTLDSEGNIIYNNKYNKWLQAKYQNNTCKNCNIYPICTQCMQHRLEQFTPNNYMAQCSENIREEILTNRLTQLINHA